MRTALIGTLVVLAVGLLWYRGAVVPVRQDTDTIGNVYRYDISLPG